MADNNEVVSKLRFAADLSAVESSARTLRQYIQATRDALKAESDLNSASLKLASSQKLVDDSLRSSFSSQVSSRLSDLKNKTEAETQAMQRLRASIEGVKNAADDLPDLKDSDFNGGGDKLAAGRQFLGAAGSIASRVSPEAGTGISVISSIVEANKELPKFKDAISELPPVALAAGAAFAGLVAGLEIGNRVAVDNTAAIRDVTGRTKEYYELLVTGTTDSINAKIAEAELQKRIAQAQVDELSFVADGYDEVHRRAGALSGVADGIIEIAGALGGKNFKDIRDARIKYDEANASLAEANKNLDLYKGLLDDTNVKENDRNAALKEESQIQDQLLEKQISRQVREAQLLRSGTENQVQGRIESLLDENAAIVNVIASGKASAEELDRLSARLGDNNAELEDLQTNILGVVRLREAEAAAAKKQEEITLKSAASYEKYLNDVRKLDDDSIQARIAQMAKYNQTLVTIAQEASKAAETALSNLIQKRDELSTKLVQDETDAETKKHIDLLDDQIKFQRDTVRLAKEHQRDLEKIQRDAADREHDLLLARDFSGLYDLQRQTSRQLEESNTAYGDQQDNRLEAFQQENEDRQRHFVEEQQQRQVNYQRQLNEAQAQYTRERDLAVKNRNEALQRAADANNQELLLISQKHDQALTMRRDAELAELQLIRQSDEEKLKLTKQYADSAQAFLQNLATYASGLSGGSSGGGGGGRRGIQATPYASGGSIAAGQRALVNEPGSSRQESFSAGGRSIAFPGMGIFTPSQSGNINPGRGGIGSLTLNQYFTGGDEERMGQIAEERTIKVIKEFLDE